MSETYSILVQPYYDSVHQCYTKVLKIDRTPLNHSPILQILKRIHSTPLSPFQTNLSCDTTYLSCKYVFLNPGTDRLAQLNDVPIVFQWLRQHGYLIDTALTTMMHQGDVKGNDPLLCFITSKIDS